MATIEQAREAKEQLKNIFQVMADNPSVGKGIGISGNDKEGYEVVVNLARALTPQEQQLVPREYGEHHVPVQYKLAPGQARKL